MITPHEMLKLELFFNKSELPYITDYKKGHSKILSKIRDMVLDDVPLPTIKKKLMKLLKELYSSIPDSILETAIGQGGIINTVSDVDNISTSPTGVLTMGLSLNEMITSRLNTHYRMVISDIVNNNLPINDLKRKNLNAIVSLSTGFNKSSRENQYDRVFKKAKKLKGWLYLAILDRRTSSLCIGLNNRFYPIDNYPTRGSLPYIPNVSTHLRCRSSIVPVYKDDNIEDLENLTLSSFLDMYPIEGKKILGDERWELYKSGKYPITSTFDIKNNIFFTNKEILESVNR